MNKKVMKLASAGKRLGAYCLDKIVPFILFCVVVGILIRMSTISGMESMIPYTYGFSMGSNGFHAVGTVFSVFVVIAVAVLYLVVQVFFYTKSKTIGKAIMGLQVISSVDGKPVGVFHMILREWFAKKASGAVFLLGYLWVLIDDKNRGWHDKIMDTYVIDLTETARYNVTSDHNAGQDVETTPDVEVDQTIEVTHVDEVKQERVVIPEGGTTIGEL